MMCRTVPSERIRPQHDVLHALQIRTRVANSRRIQPSPVRRAPASMSPSLAQIDCGFAIAIAPPRTRAAYYLALTLSARARGAAPLVSVT